MEASTAASPRNIATNPGSASKSSCKYLIATSTPEASCLATTTSPNPPAPSAFSCEYPGTLHLAMPVSLPPRHAARPSAGYPLAYAGTTRRPASLCQDNADRRSWAPDQYIFRRDPPAGAEHPQPDPLRRHTVAARLSHHSRLSGHIGRRQTRRCALRHRLNGCHRTVRQSEPGLYGWM